jgi:chromosomal replication initiator protein
MDMHLVWAKTLRLLKSCIVEATYDAYIKPLTPHAFEGNIFYLRTHDDFHKPTINKRYLFDIRRCLAEEMDMEELDVIILSPEDINGSPTGSQKHANYNKTHLRSGYIFETFVEGKCNQMAVAAAKAVADATSTTGVSSYNPLFLYGGVGLGKTHLMHAIGNQVFEAKPNLKIRYLSSETFTTEFIHALRTETMPEFIKKYRDCDLILIDDVQFLEGKKSTQEEMFYTFNALYDNNKQIVLTSDLPTGKLDFLPERLTSRFAMGLQVDITMPDYETRAAILDKKLRREQIDIPIAVKEFILKNIVSNIRDLEGALNKITAYARLSNVAVSLDLAETALKDQLVGHTPPVITLPYIQKIIMTRFNLTVEEITSSSRKQEIVYPRQIAMYLSRKLMDVSQPEIAKFYKKRDHSTVIHSCEKIAAELEYDAKLRETIAELEKAIKGE